MHVSQFLVDPCLLHLSLVHMIPIQMDFYLILCKVCLKGGPGASGRVLPPVTGRSRVRVAVSSHCTGEGKACH